MEMKTGTHVRLQAYHDGELDSGQRARVEAHLAVCATCRDELAALRTLSVLLHAAPPATLHLSEERFVAQVMLRLPRRPERTRVERVLVTGWRLIPAVLVGAWFFLQAAALLTTAVTGILALGVGTQTVGALLPAGGAGWGNTLIRVLPTIVRWLVPEALPAVEAAAGSLAWLGIVLGVANLLLPLSVALFLWSWLASWMASRRHALRPAGA